MLSKFNIFYIPHMDLIELGRQIHSKRVELGILQDQLARLTGLSRVTINQLENGMLSDIGYLKLKAILDVIGINMDMHQSQGMKNALAVVARSISTSYKDVMTPDTLKEILQSGVAPMRFHAHMMSLLDETPLPIIVKAVSEASTDDIPAKKIMKNLHQWATQWKTHRRAF
jgi:transcriptional regulator with XRE-family HTH domain